MSSRFQVCLTNLDRNYFDNRVDNEYRPIDYTNMSSYGYSTAQQILRNKFVAQNDARLRMNSIRNGYVTFPVSKISQNPNTVLLKDIRTNWIYVYFLEDTNRLANDFVEFEINLDFYATFGEEFFFGQNNNLHKGLRIYKSNKIPIPFTRYENGAPVGADLSKWEWLNHSASQLPENLDINSNNNYLNPNFNPKVDSNVFEATYFPGAKSYSHYQVRNIQTVSSNNNIHTNSPALKSFELWSPDNNFYKTFKVCANATQFFSNSKPAYDDMNYMGQNQWANDLNGLRSKMINDFKNSCDTDLWVLVQITGTLFYDGYSWVRYWDGFLVDNEKYITTLAFPVGSSNSELLRIKRFCSVGAKVLSITRLRSQNFIKHNSANAVMFFKANFFGFANDGNNWDKNKIYGAFVLTTVSPSLSSSTPAKTELLGWCHKVQTSVVFEDLAPKEVVKTPSDLWSSMNLISGNHRFILSYGDRWSIYDWTKFQGGFKFDLYYTNLGYEMFWINGRFFQDNPAIINTWFPWRENNLSLGLSSIKEVNAEAFDNTLMESIRKNGKSWEVAHNQSQYNFNVARETRLRDYAKFRGTNLADGMNTMGIDDEGNVSQGLGYLAPSLSGIAQGVTNLLNPNKVAQQRSESKAKYVNALYDTKKLPAMYQDLQNSNVGSYPAGDSWMTDRTAINMWFVSWYPQFTIDVYNYLTKEGWINLAISNWTPAQMNLTNSSAVFEKIEGTIYPSDAQTYTISQYISFAKFFPNTNLINQNIYRIARAKGLMLDMTAVKWLNEWVTSGVRIVYDSPTRGVETFDMSYPKLTIKKEPGEYLSYGSKQSCQEIEEQNSKPRKSRNARNIKTNS